MQCLETITRTSNRLTAHGLVVELSAGQAVKGEIGASHFACTDSDSLVTYKLQVPLSAKVDDFCYILRFHSFVRPKTRHKHVLSCYLQRQILNVPSNTIFNPFVQLIAHSWRTTLHHSRFHAPCH